MAYYRHTEMRAKFAKLGIQAGKAVLTFEVGGEELYNLPTLALLTGEKVRIDIESDQSVLLIEEGTGEVQEEQETVEEPETEQEADAFDDDLDAIFGAA